MAVIISEVESGSYAQKAGIEAGDTLLSINGHPINDILDYRFYETNRQLTVRTIRKDGSEGEYSIRKTQYDAIGLGFSTYLMDQKRTCRNRCIFCFIDQMPPGMRESLYFKDDDDRLSFLFGNYITLTNLKEHDVQRIIDMHISPINISVHTTNPELRVRMMKNRFAGESLKIMKRLADAGIRLNCQFVLCPGINDGEELERSLNDLSELFPAVESIAAVPVGLTKYREGLEKLIPYTKEEAGGVIDLIDRYGDRFQEMCGERIVYASDEFYLKAGREIPPPEYYGSFSQLEDGVGGMACLKEEFLWALEDLDEKDADTVREFTVATGVDARNYMQELLDEASRKCHNLAYDVIAIRNDFFGETITVAGLVTGRDLITQMKGRMKGNLLLIPEVMLRQGEDVFLDDVTVQDVENELQVRLVPVPNDGQKLLDAVLGR